MTPADLTDFHRYLCYALPADMQQIQYELEVSRRAKLPCAASFPKDAAELREALRTLEIRGLVVKEGSEWRWKAEAVKEPQGSFSW